jgi:hypothetical protein
MPILFVVPSYLSNITHNSFSFFLWSVSACNRIYEKLCICKAQHVQLNRKTRPAQKAKPMGSERKGLRLYPKSSGGWSLVLGLMCACESSINLARAALPFLEPKTVERD